MAKVAPKVKYDRRRKYYIVLDCETATLPYAGTLPPNVKKDVAIAKPLIYDLGWQLIDKKGNVYSRKNYLISEIFSVPSIFDTAYYASKRPIYLDKMKKGEITLTDWKTAVAELVEDMSHAEAVGAYNSMFDFKKAIPFTERYINALYSPDFHKWLSYQEEICKKIASGVKMDSPTSFDPNVFIFRGVTYPLFDLWGLSCKYLLNNDEYRETCIRNGWQTESGKYFKTSAETAYRFMTGQTDFDEAHTAVNDAMIESEFFPVIVKKAKNKVEIGILYFPFRLVGKVEDFLSVHPELSSF